MFTVARHAKTVVEYRYYALPVNFPIFLLSGECWRISDIPAGVLHFHNCMEIGLCESDGGTLEFADTSFAFKAGTVTAISRDMPHTTYSTPGTASKWSYLFADPEELLRPFFPLTMLPNFQLFDKLLYNYRAVLDRADYPAVYLLASGIVREMQERLLNYEISVRGLFLSLMTELTRISSGADRESLYNALPIAPALEHVSRHYAENFSVEDLAAECLMSTSHFRRVFVRIMGIGPLEHLNRTRILKACTLLRMTEDSILRISEQVGFRSLSSFNRHFSKITGEAPTSWRKRINTNRTLSILKHSGWMKPPQT